MSERSEVKVARGLLKQGVTNLSNAILLLHYPRLVNRVGRATSLGVDFADGAAVEEEKVASAITFRDSVQLLEI